MRYLMVAVLAGLAAFALASPFTHQTTDKQLLQKQKDTLELFWYVNQPIYHKPHLDIANAFNLEKSYSLYTKPEVAEYFYKIYQYGLLPKGEIFSVFYKEHLEQAIALYKLFYYAKDYDTFFKTAVWARNYVNEGLFLYSYSVAVVHRADTYGVVLPPIYEVYPNYFFSSEVIQKVQQYKQEYNGETTDGPHYTINANYSGYYLNLDPEQSLSYFTEDVGINSFYYYYNIFYPFWLGGEDFDYKFDRRGEVYYYVHQQILARYYLERLSNGFGKIPSFNWETPFETGYYPSLRYPNGLEFPTRPNHAHLEYEYSYTFVKDYERRIRDTIAKGYIYLNGTVINLRSYESIEILGSLIESNVDSFDNQYYGALQTYARHLLGYSYRPLNKYQVAPSALEHFETSLRDPAFYQFYKKIGQYFIQYQNTFPAYTQKELYFNGVQVTKVKFDRLITFFDYFYSDLSTAVYVTPEEYQSGKFAPRARQYRLNFKPFTYQINVQSSQEQKASVRIYLGPKYDEYGRVLNISESRLGFVEFDHFTYSLKAGENVIERNSQQNSFYQNDRTSNRELYKQVLGALSGNGQFTVSNNEAYFGFPRRFLLPKGNYGGQEYQFYVIVSPYVAYESQSGVDATNYYYPKVGSGLNRVDGYPLGYPFNRPIYYEQFFYDAPNSYFYNTKIYHRSVSDVNAVQQ